MQREMRKQEGHREMGKQEVRGEMRKHKAYREMMRCGGREDVIVEDRLGRENLYRLIYAGKVIKEEDLVSDLGMNGKLPVVVMMTKPGQNMRKEVVETEEVKMKRVRTVTEDSGFGDEDGQHQLQHCVDEKGFV